MDVKIEAHDHYAMLPIKQTTNILQINKTSRIQSSNSLQVPESTRSNSQNSSQSESISFSQLSVRASTRQSNPSSMGSKWSSVSNITRRTSSSLKASLYPSSGFPGVKPDQSSYPSNGYPTCQQRQHTYGYPVSPYPVCLMPTIDLSAQSVYPTSDFPTGGAFPGEFDVDDGSQPFIKNGVTDYGSS